MTFRALDLLWSLAALPLLLIFLLARERHRTHVARRFVSERLRGVANAIRPLRPWLLTLGIGFTLVAAAGPRAGFTTMKVSSRESNRIVLVDVSNSMGANDVGTTRLAAAKALARRIVDAHAGRVALIVFEGSAEIVSPLTSDSGAVGELLDTVMLGEVGHPGSDLGAALDSALRLAEGDRTAKADLVVISDGEDQGSRLGEALRRLRERRIVASCILVGSSSGSAIPTGEMEVLRDENGNRVTTYARPDTLQSIASATGGVFLENPFSEHALDPLLTVRRRGAAREASVQIPIERYQWPLAAAFVLLLLGSVVNRGAE